jgi:GNAT superfamily N-acetyltransferase
MSTSFILREMAFSDGPAINALARQCPDGGSVSVRSVFRENAFHSLESLRPETVGVAAESPRHDGIVGMGWVSLGRCRMEGDMVPYALLHTFMVHPEWRGQGIAATLSNKVIEYATTRLGHKILLVADIQAGNRASRRTAGKWSNQVLPAVTVAPVTVRRREPGMLAGVTIQPLTAGHTEAFAQGLNAFYEGYNLFQPETADSLTAWLSQRPQGLHVHHCLTATDPHGRLLAGLALEEACRLRTYQIVHMPAVLRLANRLLHVVPADGILREILVSRFWFQPGREAAARCLWEQARWQCRERGTALMAFYDPRSPLARVIALKPWSVYTTMDPVIRWHTPVSPDHLVYPIP